MENDIAILQERIGYKFKSESLLKKALCHSSYVYEKSWPRGECNERLEFLGDAVLEMISSGFLYNKFDEVPEGELTKLRASLVCEPALAYDAREIGLDSFILLGHGEERTGGRKRDSIVSDACEALIGAIYLDGGIEAAEKFILSFVLNDIEHKKLFYDSKTALQELTQSAGWGVPDYEITGQSGPDHARVFTAQVSLGEKILGTGEGTTKKHAQQKAAYNALLKLQTAGRGCT